jgi:hypothetical protein
VGTQRAAAVPSRKCECPILLESVWRYERECGLCVRVTAGIEEEAGFHITDTPRPFEVEVLRGGESIVVWRANGQEPFCLGDGLLVRAEYDWVRSLLTQDVRVRCYSLEGRRQLWSRVLPRPASDERFLSIASSRVRIDYVVRGAVYARVVSRVERALSPGSQWARGSLDGRASRPDETSLGARRLRERAGCGAYRRAAASASRSASWISGSRGSSAAARRRWRRASGRRPALCSTRPRL